MFFQKILQFYKFDCADFKYDYFFQIPAQKCPNKAFLVKNTQTRHFWSQIWVFLFSRKILKLDKIEGPDLKFDNSFLKFLPQNTQIRYFFSPKFSHFSFFHKMLQLDKFEGTDFKYDNIIFKVQSKITQIKHFWSQILGFLFLYQTLQQRKFKMPI